MQNIITIALILPAIIFGIVIVAAVRKALRNRATIRRRLAEISDRGMASSVGLARAFPADHDTEDFLVRSIGRGAEVTSINPADALVQMGVADDTNMQEWREHMDEPVPLYQRVRSARMNEIIAAADDMQRESLIQAAIRLGSTREIGEAYADEILDEGEPLPAAMSHAPNLGSDDLPYRGPNYVEPAELVEEMKGIRHYGTEPAPVPQIWDRRRGWIDAPESYDDDGALVRRDD